MPTALRLPLATALLLVACGSPAKVFGREKAAMGAMIQAISTLESVSLPPSSGDDIRSPGAALRFPPASDANAMAIPQSAILNPASGGRFERFYAPLMKVARWLSGAEFLPESADEVRAATSAVKGLEYVLLLSVEEWVEPVAAGDRFEAGRAVVRGDLIRLADKSHYGAIRVDVASSPTSLSIVRPDGSGRVPDALLADLEKQVFGHFRSKLGLKLRGTQF